MNYLHPSICFITQPENSFYTSEGCGYGWAHSPFVPQNYLNFGANSIASSSYMLQFPQFQSYYSQNVIQKQPELHSSSTKKQKQDQNQKKTKKQQVKTKRIQKQNRRKRYKSSQNPKRNVVTNLGNQLLSYIGNKFKLSLLFLKVFQDIEEEVITSLLVYVRKIRNSIGSYLNVEKLREYWFQTNGKRGQQKTLSLFRKVSYYYLTNYSHLQVCKSLKLKGQTQKYHLEGRRILLSALKRQVSTR